MENTYQREFDPGWSEIEKHVSVLARAPPRAPKVHRSRITERGKREVFDLREAVKFPEREILQVVFDIGLDFQGGLIDVALERAALIGAAIGQSVGIIQKRSIRRIEARLVPKPIE